MQESEHKRKRPFKCQLCEKSYLYACNLKQHERIHSNYKPFKCEYCDKKFFRSDLYKEHKRMHTDERPYNCQYCKKAFRALRTRKEHERVHTGEKPYTCQYCGRKFTQCGVKARHERLLHTKKEYIKSNNSENHAINMIKVEKICDLAKEMEILPSSSLSHECDSEEILELEENLQEYIVSLQDYSPPEKSESVTELADNRKDSSVNVVESQKDSNDFDISNLIFVSLMSSNGPSSSNAFIF